MAQATLIRTAFLDTNALLQIFAFWEACKVSQVSMDAVKSWQQLQTFGLGNGDDFEDIKNGMKCFQRLDQAKEDCNYFSCQVCRSEMHRVILDACALEGLIRKKVPFSVRNKRPLIVYRRVLEDEDYETINEQVNKLFEDLRVTHNIDIKILEERAHGMGVSSEQIFQTAQVLWSHVLIETMDAYIYAAAIQCLADYFLTSDGALKNMINGLYSASGDWKLVANDLKVKLKSHLPDNVVFPKGISPHKCFLN